jgi:hypothetical protein
MRFRSMGMAICFVAVATAGCGTAHASQPDAGAHTSASMAYSSASATAAKRNQVSRAEIASTAAPASCRHVTGKSLVLTLASNRKTICVRVGTPMDVYLQGTRSQPWREPVATGHALTGIPNGAFSLPVGVAAASYAAVRPGQALIPSVRPPCAGSFAGKNELEPAGPVPGPYPIRVCAPDRVFVVTIIVLR